MLVQHCSTICDAGPTANQHWFNASCLLTAAGQVVLTAGGDYKPTPTQCMLNVGPASPVLASIHSVSNSCWRELVHIQRGTVLQTAKWKYLLISLVCILPSFGRAVTGTAAESEMEVSAFFTSVHITVFWKGCDRLCSIQRNRKICFFYKRAYTVYWKGCERQKRVQ